ncbi:unnamed protein product [Lactuca virosa]|uniref:non-specific serine/threonine protein kinase n=1 Tax=Lactuca virosa TaxID=75947 RepID=A0AAU9PBF1_9ASTR|nr:unnamed protein product [Lactuca virosa]
MESRLVLSHAPGEVITELSTADAELVSRSWNLFAILLSIGRPVPSIELASRCSYLDVSPEFIEFVCSIPNSPLSLTDDGLVTVSSAVCIGLQRFLLNSGRVFKISIPWEMKTRDFERKRAWEDFELTCSRKRRRSRPNISEKADQTDLSMSVGISNAFEKQYAHGDDHTSRSLIITNDNTPVEDEKESTTVLSMKELAIQNNFLNGYICFPSPIKRPSRKRKDSLQLQSSSHPTERPVTRSLTKRHSKASCQEDKNKKVISLLKTWIENSTEKQTLVMEREHKCILDSSIHEVNIENVPNNIVHESMIPELNCGNINTMNCNDMAPCSDNKEKAVCQEVEEQKIVSLTDAGKLCINEAQMDDVQEEEKPICEREQLVCSQDTENNLHDNKQLTAVPKDANLTVPTVSITTNNENDLSAPTEQKNSKKDKKSALMKQKLKPSGEQKIEITRKQENIKENKEKCIATSVKGNLEPREVPVFDSFIVEEEEGSGGYGTVYKARSKKDGTTFAVKNPHENANRNHVYNELKMLERFGGKNFVIKYEGSFKSGNSHCLVLEHVAHDRPEVLKREIDVQQLRWYGYCLFRALSSLHKQGVVHRDVKPGNFLFSLKASKGYLIDFNLATDLHQKFGSTEKSKLNNDASFGLPPTKTRKYTSSKALEPVTHIKKKSDQIKMKSQGADGSGITSTKDATSNRIPSAERLREPIPSTQRKELLNLVHEALQGPDQPITSKRKRVAAPPTKSDNKKLIYLTPMPLQSTGIAVSGAGLLKNKQRKEGPCVGTKGFRAPEVLFKSMYQGPKIDVWSAGVTLLYLIIGRTPFGGDPDQNIKEIAKLRGSEDLWEVAKLHDRESSFPPELYQLKSLPSVELREWCKQNTRRPDFLIPKSLIDLVDKCLMVNPRARISAEEALRHEFFMPCFKDIEKHRLLRQKPSQPVTFEGLP